MDGAFRFCEVVTVFRKNCTRQRIQNRRERAAALFVRGVVPVSMK